MRPLRPHSRESVSPHRRLRTDRPGPGGHRGPRDREPRGLAPGAEAPRSPPLPSCHSALPPRGPRPPPGPLQVTGGARGSCAAPGDPYPGRAAQDELPREPPGDLWQRAPSDRPPAAPRPAPALPSTAARGAGAAGGGKKSGRSVPVAMAVTAAASSAAAARGHGPAAQRPRSARPEPPPPPQPRAPPPPAPPPPAPPRSAPPPLSRRFPPSPTPAAAAATAARSHWRESGGRPGSSRGGGGARPGPVPATPPGGLRSLSRLLPCPSPSPRECGHGLCKDPGSRVPPRGWAVPAWSVGAGGYRPLVRGRLSWPAGGLSTALGLEAAAWVLSDETQTKLRPCLKILCPPSFHTAFLNSALPDSSGQVCI